MTWRYFGSLCFSATPSSVSFFDYMQSKTLLVLYNLNELSGITAEDSS